MEIIKRTKQLASYLAPGMFIIGYVIGTGSVTSMSVAGAGYGMSLLWALLLSCCFTFVMLSAISRLTMASGKTLLYLIKIEIHWSLSLLLFAGLCVSIISSVVGVMGVVTEVLQEWSKPLSTSGEGWSQVLIALVLSSLLYVLFLTGKHKHFLKVISLLVALMGLAFLATNFIVVTDPKVIMQGLVPKIPSTGNAPLIISGMIGTTMAGVVLVSRSILVQENGWTLKDLSKEQRDAALSMFLTFIISGSIMASAAGTLYINGITIDNAIEMVNMLEPLAGRLAVNLFVTGIVAAGLSSIFPNLLLLPWLIADYQGIPRNIHRPLFKFIVLGIAVSALIIPIFGGKPVFLLIASQAFSPLIMPLLTLLLIILLNNKKLMREHKACVWMNMVLGITFAFSLFTFYTAWIGFIDYIKQ